MYNVDTGVNIFFDDNDRNFYMDVARILEKEGVLWQDNTKPTGYNPYEHGHWSFILRYRSHMVMKLTSVKEEGNISPKEFLEVKTKLSLETKMFQEKKLRTKPLNW